MLLNLCLLGTLGLVSIATAETIKVEVGPGLTISPASITAAVGDEIEFEIYQGHTITEGDGFANPCQYKPGGFFSDFGDDQFVFTVAITDTSPKWIYCSSFGHCQDGMVAVINPSGDNTLDDYIAAAEGAPDSTAPDAQVGGVTGGETSSSAAEPTETSTPSEPTETSTPSEPTETPATSEETTTTTESVETPTPSSNLTASITQPPVQTANAAPSIFTGETVMMNALMGLIAVAAGWAGLL